MVGPRNQSTLSSGRTNLGASAYNTAIDRIRNQMRTIVESKAGEFNKDKGTFLGILLASAKPMSLDEFTAYFPANESFFAEVLQKSGKKIKPAPDGYFLESYVHIPEITSMLPFPNVQHIYDFNTIYSSDAPVEEKQRSLESKYPQLLTELIKGTCFPKFYKYCDNGEIYTPGRFVKVRYPGSFPTYGIGVLEEVYQGVYKPE